MHFRALSQFVAVGVSSDLSLLALRHHGLYSQYLSPKRDVQFLVSVVTKSGHEFSASRGEGFAGIPNPLRSDCPTM